MAEEKLRPSIEIKIGNESQIYEPETVRCARESEEADLFSDEEAYLWWHEVTRVNLFSDF